jgi:hypothetical protein
LGVEARTVVLVDTALASPFDYIAQVLMLTLVAIYAPEGKKGTWLAHQFSTIVKTHQLRASHDRQK